MCLGWSDDRRWSFARPQFSIGLICPVYGFLGDWTNVPNIRCPKEAYPQSAIKLGHFLWSRGFQVALEEPLEAEHAVPMMNQSSGQRKVDRVPRGLDQDSREGDPNGPDQVQLGEVGR